MEESEIKLLEEQIVSQLKTVFDPEIPVNIYDLGLVYEIRIEEKRCVKVLMTLTAPGCPIADEIVKNVKEKVENVEGVESADVELTFDPPWDMGMMSLEAKVELGFA